MNRKKLSQKLTYKAKRSKKLFFQFIMLFTMLENSKKITVEINGNALKINKFDSIKTL